MRTKRSVMGLLFIVIALVLSADTVLTSSPRADASTASTAVVSLEEGYSANWFNPILSSAVCTIVNLRTIQSMMYRPVLMPSTKVTIDWADSMASAVTPSKLGTSYAVTLKSYKWSDGTPITASDVAAYYYLVKYGAKTGTCLYGLGGLPNEISNLKVVNPKKFVIDYAPRSAGYNPTWVMLNALTWLSALPIKQWVAACPGSGFDASNPSAKGAAALWNCLNKQGANYKWKGYDTVSGPYKIDTADWQTGSQFTFIKNAKFSGHAPSLDKLTLLYEASSTDIFTGLRSGTLNAGVIPAALVPEANSLSGYTYSPQSTWAESRITLDLASAQSAVKKAFNDKQVRIALQMGVDSRTIIGISNGVWYPNYGPLPSRPDTYLSPQLKSGSPYPFNLAKAKKVLAADGYKTVNGVQTKNGFALKFKLAYPSGDTTIASVAQLLQSDWAKIGVKVSLPSMQAQTLTDAQFNPTQAKQLQASVTFPNGWSYQPDYYPSGETLWNCNGTSTAYFGFVCNKTLDQLIVKTSEYSTNATAAQRVLNSYQNFIADNAYALFVPAGWGDLVVSNTLGGVKSHFTSYIWYPEYWHGK